MRTNRLVILPDYQGIGLAAVMMEWVGQYLYERSERCINMVAHPAMIAYHSRSPRWKLNRKKGLTAKQSASSSMRRGRALYSRATASFEYKPKAAK